MKKVLFLASLLVMVMVASTTMANQVKIYQGYYQSGIGGEFRLQGADSDGTDAVTKWAANYDNFTKNQGATPSIQTFCLEHGETFSYGAPYNYALSTKAMYGGVGPAGDEISMGTAWLYSQFAHGGLADYDYATGRTTSAGLLQNAIWYLENEVTPTSGNTFYQAAIDHFGNLSNASADAGGKFGVRVLNLTDSDGRHQDQLVVVPVPPSVWLLGSGLVGLFGLRRRFFG